MSQKIYNLKELKLKTLILTQTDPLTDMMFRTWIKNGMNADIIFSPKPKSSGQFAVCGQTDFCRVMSFGMETGKMTLKNMTL